MKDFNEIIRIVLSETNAEGCRLLSEQHGIDYAFESYKKFAQVMRAIVDKYGEPSEVMQLTKITPAGATYSRRKANKDEPEGGIIKRWTSNPYGDPWVRYEADGFDFSEIEELIRQAISEIKFDAPKYNKEKTDDVLIAVYTDTHIGMETNDDGHSLYGGTWNADVLKKRFDDFIQDVINNAQGREVHIFDLGDYADGWDAMTARKGHSLPQNMDNYQCFKVGVKAKLNLAMKLSHLDVRFHNITNDNHAADFGKIINESVKMMIGDRFMNYHQFINHVIIGRHAIIFSHGKDDKNLKFGFQPIMNDKARAKIEEYIDFHRLHDYHITFMKGDSHRKLFDDSNYKFRYYNYPAISPASEWVQTNFSKGRSGYVMHTFNKTNGEIKTVVNKEYDWA